MHDGEWFAPVALATEEPIAEFVVDGGLALVAFGEPGGDFFFEFGCGQAVELVAVDGGAVANKACFALHDGLYEGRNPIASGVFGRHDSGLFGLGVFLRHFALRHGIVCRLGYARESSFLVWFDDGDDGEVESLGEFEVALVVGGYGHDGAGAVADEYVVADPDGDFFVADGVYGVGTGGDAGFFFGEVSAVEVTFESGFGDVILYFGTLLVGGDGVDEGVFGGEDHVGGAEEGVGAGGEYADGGVVIG